jgi:hypothetical protein
MGKPSRVPSPRTVGWAMAIYGCLVRVQLYQYQCCATFRQHRAALSNGWRGRCRTRCNYLAKARIGF